MILDVRFYSEFLLFLNSVLLRTTPCQVTVYKIQLGLTMTLKKCRNITCIEFCLVARILGSQDAYIRSVLSYISV